MADKKPIDENALNDLLRDLYLDKNSKAIDESEAQFIMQQEYAVKIDPGKEKELLEKLHKNSNGFGGFKLYLSLFSVFIILCFLLWFFVPGNSNTAGHSVAAGQKKLTNTQAGRSNPSSIETGENSTIVTSKQLNTIPDTFGKVKVQKAIATTDSLHAGLPENTILTDQKQKPETAVPYITEKDKIRYTKIKNLMLLKLYKSDKGLYTYVPADKMECNNKTIIIQPFTIRNMGITNLEYKTFLADLLIQKRNDDYLAARVLSDNWNTYKCPNLANTYFQDDLYNDFPVVNITIEGVKLFCKWLEEESRLFMKQNNLKAKPIAVRLPYDEEWIYVAYAGYAKIPYEKGYNTIFDADEGFIDNSFIKRIELVKKRANRSDTLYRLLAINKYGWNEKDIMEFFSAAFRSYNVTPGDTIYAERMKVFGKTAYVSQMVPEKKSAHIWFIGISWKNKEEYTKMQNEFKAAGSSPFVGFRPVILNSNDSQYKNPFW
ncbi:MAG TPA: SUMF1/EgtB/PvdO family nonheme iron enzyme [Bacteroidia bacterium]|jgi:hypothetical protein|nr:SUMF1/EgtB/PvdO family nonheme iron enzyme [Bacteroidia bacterium]